MERSHLLVKPDGVALGITDAVVESVRARGAVARLVGEFSLDRELVDLWYPEICDEPGYAETVRFLTSGPLRLIEVRASDAFGLTHAIKREWRAAYRSELRRGMLHCPDGPIDFRHEWEQFAPLAEGRGFSRSGPSAFPWCQRIAAVTPR